MFPPIPSVSLFFSYTHTSTTEIYTFSLHDALPICRAATTRRISGTPCWSIARHILDRHRASRTCSRRARSLECSTTCWISPDRKSTRLNSSHSQISYAVFCLKKKKKNHYVIPQSTQ